MRLKIKIILIFFLISFYLSLNLVYSQTENKEYIKEGDWVKYSWEATEAFIPYASKSIYIIIVNISDPDDIKINVTLSLDGKQESLLNESISASYYVLNNYTLVNNWSVCPNNILVSSEIKNHWNSSNLSNVSEVYYDVKRDGIELKYEQDNIILGSYHYNVSVRWVWDKYTGVMLSNYIVFNNLDEPTLSGSIKQYLSETSIWSLSTGGAIDFNNFSIIVTIILGYCIATLLISKRIKIRRNT